MFKLTTEEFNSLKQHFFDNVIVGKNVFYKTNPSELERFKNFIRDLPPHDVVIDGLNVAYSIGTKQPPTVLSSLVSRSSHLCFYVQNIQHRTFCILFFL